MTMTILQLSVVLRTMNLWLFHKKKTKQKQFNNKQKHQTLEAALHHNKETVAWPKTKTNFKLRRTKQKQNKIKLKNRKLA